MNKKIVDKIGVVTPMVLYVLLISLVGIFIPTNENRTVMLFTIVIWSAINLYCRWKKKFFFSFLLSLLAALSLSSIMLAKEAGFLDTIDTLAAHTFGTAVGIVSQSIIGISVFLAVTLMNYFIDSIDQITRGQSRGLKRLSELAVRLAGPVVMAGIMFGVGYVKNKTGSESISNMISFAEAKERAVDKNTPLTKTDFNPNHLPTDLLEKIKFFENGPLASGKIKASIYAKDPLKKRTILQVGYGITGAEIHEAIRLGFLPKGSKLPKRLTKKEADAWFKKITIPTYLAQVKEILNPKISLTGRQLVALVSFCHNLGKGNLKTLIDQPGRLNDGNIEQTLVMLVQYVHADGIEHKGLVTRRDWEKELLKKS